MWVYSFVIILLVVTASFFKAVMDRLENDGAFGQSVFKNMRKEFWLKTVSWMHARKIFRYRVDAWHLAWSVCIVCLLSAISVGIAMGYAAGHIASYIVFDIFFYIGYVVLLGVVWNFTFNVFYHHTLFKKN